MKWDPLVNNEMYIFQAIIYNKECIHETMKIELNYRQQFQLRDATVTRKIQKNLTLLIVGFAVVVDYVAVVASCGPFLPLPLVPPV